MSKIVATFQPKVLETLRPELAAAIGLRGTFLYAGTGGEGEPYPSQTRWTPVLGDPLYDALEGRWVPEEDLTNIDPPDGLIGWWS